MTLPVPRLPFSLDPLIAEAKRRANRRRLLGGCLLVGLAGAATVASFMLRSPESHRLTLPPTHRAGIARIPGMTRLASSGWMRGVSGCPLIPGGKASLPPVGGDGYLCGGWVAGVLRQIWVSSAAVAEEGTARLRREMTEGYPYSPIRLPAEVIRRPGPAEVEVEVQRLMSWPAVEKSRRRAAEQMVRTGYFEGGGGTFFTPLPRWTINGGVARHIHSDYNAGMNKFQFIWAAGTRVVMVNVFGGRRLHLADAQRVAARAGPSQ